MCVFQVLCLAEFIQFTERCEAAIKSHGLMDLQRMMKTQLENYTSVDINSADMQDVDTNVLELKLKALILDTIHNIDLIEQLEDSRISNPQEWLWQKQLRSVNI